MDAVRGNVCATIKYDAAGNRQWLACYPSESNSYGGSLALDTMGNVYVGLYSDGEDRLVKYVQTGDVREQSPSPGRAPWLQAFPNPFSSAVSLRYSHSGIEPVNLKIIDVTGREIRRLVAGSEPAGEHCISWDARTEAGWRARPGVYFCLFTTGSTTLTRKLLLQ
jgi:hypothetical protein